MREGAGSMDWVLIVGVDTTAVEFAGHTLAKSGIRATSLNSGAALLDYLEKNPSVSPDLILMDVGADGFETLKKLRALGIVSFEIPVIALGDEKQTSETLALQLGAIDYIRKPFAPDILVSRVRNVLRTQEKMQQFEREATRDSMTGLLNKNSAEEKIKEVCLTEVGFLCVLDLDSFKLVNDLYGHDMGDRALILFSNLLRNSMRSEDVCGRIGGDEFLVFAKNMRSEEELLHFTRRINDSFVVMMRELLGEQLKFTVGISVGAAAVPAHGREFTELFHLADQALSTVKMNGKHSGALYGVSELNSHAAGSLTLDSVTMILEERNISSNAMWMGREAFINIYRYMIRYMERYHGVAYRVLFTVNMTSETLAKEERADVMDRFRCMMQESLRNSDLMVEVSENQIFLLLPQTQEFGIDVVIKRLSTKWHQSAYSEKAAITWETGKVHLTDRAAPAKKPDWVVIAGGGENRDQIAEMLDRQQFRVSAPASGQALSELIIAARPDLILLDADTDGIEILRALKSGSPEVRDIPVILMVGGGTPELEERALELGAEDLIVRPFSPTLLALRVRHTIDRVRLQRSHAFELSMQPIERR